MADDTLTAIATGGASIGAGALVAKELIARIGAYFGSRKERDQGRAEENEHALALVAKLSELYERETRSHEECKLLRDELTSRLFVLEAEQRALSEELGRRPTPEAYMKLEAEISRLEREVEDLRTRSTPPPAA